MVPASALRATVREDVRVSLALAAVVVPKASDVLAARLREMILSSGLAEGTPLPTERELVAQSGLSRASVREALRVLETEGLVLTRPAHHGGSKVRRPGRDSISRSFELFVRSHGVRFEALLEAREAIEPAAAALAAIHRQDVDLAEMTRIHKALDQVTDDVAEHVRLNLMWHRAIMRASRNELLIAFFDAIADSVQAATESKRLNWAGIAHWGSPSGKTRARRRRRSRRGGNADGRHSRNRRRRDVYGPLFRR